MPVSNLWSAEKREPFPAELVLWGHCAQEPHAREIKRKTLWALQSYRATIFLSTAHKSFLLPIWCSTWINPKVGLVWCRFTSKPPTCYGHSFAVVLFTCCKSCRPGKNLFPVTPTWFYSPRYLIQVSESVPQFLNTCEPRSWCHPHSKHSHQGLVCRGSGEVWGWCLCLCSEAAYKLHPADICPWVLLLGHLLPGISSVSGCFNAKLWVCLQMGGRPVAVQVRNRQDFLDLSLQHVKPVGDASWVSFAPSLFAPALLWASTP